MTPDPESKSHLYFVAICVVALAMFAACVARGGTVIVPAGANPQGPIDIAVPGDVIVVQDGTFGSINLNNKTGIEVRAEHDYKTVLNGQLNLGGTNNYVHGVVVQGVVTDWANGAVRVTGTGNRLSSTVIRDNESIGLDIHEANEFTATSVKCLHNGTTGISSGGRDASKVWCNNITLTDIECSDNNYGMPAPRWNTTDPNKAVLRGGLWYRQPGDAAGGAKLCSMGGLVVNRGVFKNNGGPGLWFDVYNGAQTVMNCEAFNNHNIPGNQGWESPGYAVEICKGPTRYVNCYSHDNTGSDFAIWESQLVTILNCVGNRGIETRDLGGDRGPLFCRDIIFDGVKLYGGAAIHYWTPALRAARNITEKNVQTGLTGAVVWSNGGAAVTQPTTTVADPPPSKSVTDGAGIVWTLTPDGKLRRNGTLLMETSGVFDIGVVDGVFYQSATSGIWKSVGAGWIKVGFIPPPATQPVNPPPVATTRPVVRIIADPSKVDVRVGE
jgi:hypothetical protein